MDRQISMDIKIKQNPETIYRSLVTPSSITHWWEAKTAIVIEEIEGIYVMCWGDDIDDPDLPPFQKNRRVHSKQEALFRVYFI